MNIDAINLSQATKIYMRNKGLTCSQIQVDDGGWEKNGLLYLIEEKSERESIIPQSSWWKWDKIPLDGQRDYIRNNYRSRNRNEFHQNKWMIAIAQLRNAILNLNSINRTYRAIFSIPVSERNNFEQGFFRYHGDQQLNSNSYRQNIQLSNWNDYYSYIDQRGVTINVKVIEIDYDNYFGTI
ncbi:MAG: hypothetical protein ACMUIP_16920 [bacterium]